VSGLRIFFLTLALAALAVAVVGLSLHRRTLPAPKDASSPWLKVPIEMDAREWGMRFLVLRTMVDADSLLRTCQGPGAEQYAIHLSESWFKEGREDWLVRLRRSGDNFDALVSDEFPDAPPTGANPYIRPVSFPEHYSVTVADLADVRRPLGSEALWLAPQDDSVCNDGPWVTVEACVNGEYFARSRSCEEAGAMKQLDLLWSALRRHFHSPPPTVWVESN
jgi:hypothetical protein